MHAQTISDLFQLDDAISISSRSSTSSTPLPFPEPLPRTDFLTPAFDPSTYLSSLGHRHQTLEDLRSDLRSRSQLLGQELLDLVNNHYDDFLSLGSSLKGGEERVEELRVGLLGMRREVEAQRAVMGEREAVVEGLLKERRRLRVEMEEGRRLIEWEGRLGELEGRLVVEPAQRRHAKDDADGPLDGTSRDRESEEEDEDAEYDSESDVDEGVDASDTSASLALSRLGRRVKDYRILQETARRIGDQHPLIVAQQARMVRVRNTLLLDLGNAIRYNQTRKGADGSAGSTRLLKTMKLYRDLDASHEAVSVLRSLRKT